MSVIHLSALVSEKEGSIAGAVLFSRLPAVPAGGTAQHRLPARE
jgi:hypothetical protein